MIAVEENDCTPQQAHDGILLSAACLPPPLPVNYDNSFVRELDWKSSEVLGPLTSDEIRVPQGQFGAFRKVLENDLASEFDADNLCEYLKTSGLNLTSRFVAIEHAWRRDELNHFEGFLEIYCALYHEHRNDVIQRLRARPVNFLPLADLLRDEFSLCLVLAYDEIVTARSYSADRPFYREIGGDKLERWIKLVATDEAHHFHNFVDHIRETYPHRLHEAVDVVARILRWDLDGGSYGATFVLDHDGDGFSRAELEKCAGILLRKLGIVRGEQVKAA